MSLGSVDETAVSELENVKLKNADLSFKQEQTLETSRHRQAIERQREMDREAYAQAEKLNEQALRYQYNHYSDLIEYQRERHEQDMTFRREACDHERRHCIEMQRLRTRETFR